MIKILKNILTKFGVDWAIFYNSLSRVIQAIGGIVLMFLITIFMTKEEQGYYYTFASVLAIQVFFELGLGGIITQFVAHEMAHLSFINPTKIDGKSENLSRLSSLLHFCAKWYLILAGILFVSLLIIGFSFFNSFSQTNTLVKWQIPWIIISFGTSLSLLISPWMAVLQGLNKVKEMAKLAFKQQIITILICWLSLILGGKLYVAAINSIIGFILLIILYFKTEYPNLLYNIYKTHINEKISYLNEVFPFQWRIGISWISGYFIFQLFNPVIFAFNGAVAAGQMGMTLAVLNSFSLFVVSWTTTKIPLWSSFVAKREYDVFDRSLNSVLRDSTVVCVTFVLLFIGFIAMINKFQISLSDRFLPLWLVSILSVTVPINNIINSWATYLRCHKKEPFLIQAVIIGTLSCTSTVLTARYIGVYGVVVGYALITALINVPLSYTIFNVKRRIYHA